MSTLTAPERPKTQTDDICHGVHVPCQIGWRPTAKALCGTELDWDDQRTSSEDVMHCVVCMDLLVCPICRMAVHV